MGGEIEVGTSDHSIEICDYCGSLTPTTIKCYICAYDLCQDDIVTINTEDQDLPSDITDIFFCRSCVKRYYQDLNPIEYSIYR